MPKRGVIPPQFIRHPPRSWMRDMPKIKKEARADIRRTSKKGISRVGSMPRKERRSKRRYDRPVHILTDGLAVTGVAEITAPVWENLISGYKSGGLSGALTQVESALIYQGNIIDNPQVKTGAILLVASFASKVLGKHLNLNRIGTKKVKLV